MKEKRWVIVGEHGLYIGQWQLRKDAVRKHVSDLWSGRADMPVLDEFGQLTDAHREAWKRCRENGDRCVLATISY